MTVAPLDQRFSLTGPLPSGVTVLEASAGTGKTFTIAALAARFIAEGTPLHQLLLVTFTRMATGELRERVRERLVATEQELARRLAGAPVGEGDEVVALLAAGTRVEVEVRRERLAHAIENFDAATIATTHGFCQEVLGELGTLGDLEPGVTFTEDVSDLIEEVIDDLFVRRFHRQGGAPFDRAEAGLIARIAIENPTAPVHPLAADVASVPAMRRRLALAARDELERRKRALAVMTYDDLLTRLRDTLAGPGGGAAAARLQARYRVVLIDEFQDTDPVQWEIVDRAFVAGGVTVVLIADPKQAIYAFRGADVYAYLDAVKAAQKQATLRVNWRSDQALIDAYDALFGQVNLGHEGIRYRAVRAAPANQEARLCGAPSPAALRVRVVDRGEPSIKRTGGGFAQASSARSYVAKDVAADIVRLLGSQAEICVGDSAAARRVRISPGHVAVLVQSHANAALVHAELVAAGVPAVINGAGSVFGTPAARDWLHLLEALERPAYSARARSAALTPLLGWTAEQVALAEESDLEQLHQRLHAWARVLRLRGVAALADTIAFRERVPQRLLGCVDGERRLTDLQHIAQLLHEAATAQQLGTAALTSWLRERVAASREEGNRDDLTRRLESDAEAVQVLTIHRSKGLEFPVVYCPFLWEPGWIPDGNRPVYFHDAEADEVRAIDVGLEGSGYAGHKRQNRDEERGEDLRMMYVALTRAKHQAVIWWVGSWNSRDSPLGRLLFARDDDGNIRPEGSVRPSDEAVLGRFNGLAEQAPGSIGVELSRLGGPVSWSGVPQSLGELVAARFDRQLDARWRRTSYSDITAGAYEAMVGSEPEEDVVSDEPRDLAAAGAGARGESAVLSEVPVLLGEMPVGVRVGTFVHSVLEATDFDAPDLHVELASRIAAEQERSRVEIGDPSAVAAGLAAAIETPFGAVDSDLRLRHIRRADRLEELAFELPLAGGDEPTGRFTLAAIARVIASHLAPSDPLAGYAERLADPMLRRDVRGYLTGSIDLVLRVEGGGRAPRFGIVDYKTNWLGGLDEPLTAWNYRPEALAVEMSQAHYGLQALLYTAALHRYLRWRMPGYDPERNLAGVHYLFLRGMVGADTPVVGGSRCGVFTWHPPGVLVRALSDVLDGSQ